MRFGKKRTVDWQNLLEDWDGEYYWRNWAWENCSGPKKNSGDFSNRDCKSVSRDYFTTLSRPHSCVPVIIDEFEKKGTLQKYGLVPDNMNNLNCVSVEG